MLTHTLELVGQFIISVISHAGYPGVALLMAIESACIPLPSEVIMPFSGFLVYTGRFNLLGVAVAGAIGCNLGSMVAYFVGSWGGRPLIEKYGRYVLISHQDLELADRWFARYGNWTVFFARLLPMVRTFIAFPAGVSRMNILRFNIYTFLGSLPWCYLLAYAGVKLGAHWTVLREYFHRFDALLTVAFVVVAVLFVRSRWKNRPALSEGQIKASE